MLSAYGDRRSASFLFEVFIVVLTVLPILILIYFYPLLPDRVPEYLKLNGEVQVWGRKSFMSVFRLPLMAIDLQVLCILTKHAARQRTLVIDWLSAFIAIKLAHSSLGGVFFRIE